MTLIKSISGIRGTIGGKRDENLTPEDIVKFTAAFVAFIQKRSGKEKIKVVVGRDARISGEMVNHLVCGTLMGMGADILDLGLSTTPTVEVAVPMEKANAGIILTASHNPAQWNALKLLNEKGEFISGLDGEEVLAIAASGEINYAEVYDLGSYEVDDTYIATHIKEILKLDILNLEAIKAADLHVAVDAVNSTGGIAIPAMLEALGVTRIERLFCEPNGDFPHNPEPLKEHLTELSNLVVEKNCDMGIVVDPDVDRLAMVCEDGSMFGEEYTLVSVADYVLGRRPGNTVSNLSSTRALADVTHKHGQTYTASAVGEVNVVNAMKDTNAVIGGEGNGGIIFPELHYGRDSLVGVALFLSLYAEKKLQMTELRDSYPQYHMIKSKVNLSPSLDVDAVLADIKEKYDSEKLTTVDGVKIDFEEGWVHLRKSNTEPIVRVYAEGKSPEKAQALAKKLMDEINSQSVAL
ncbi:MAG: phosphoglucosamine mutase [Flavobacteriales bacterium]